MDSLASILAQHGLQQDQLEGAQGSSCFKQIEGILCASETMGNLQPPLLAHKIKVDLLALPTC